MAEPGPAEGGRPARPARAVRTALATNAGPGRVLVGVYALFALAAGARSAYQIATDLAAAPLPYLLSALAAAVYLLAAVGLAQAGHTGWRVALACCTVELVGVLAVGTYSVLAPQDFPDETVWSGYGQGYGYVPLVLPVLGLLWLRRTATRTR
ncbi:MAG TPA: hypothetical protein VFB84_03760 [Micromonosporaceae bacterium]|nr:hypothetical protein [Micromonosporaceae bacterium]